MHLRPTPRGSARPVASTALCLAGVMAAACGSSSTATPTTTAPDAAVRAAVADGASAARTDPAGVEWLCRPGHVPDPCVTDLTATVVAASGPTTVRHAAVAADPPVDCFYVYPTVSSQPGVAADLHVGPGRDGRGPQPGVPLLAGVQGLRPDVPADHPGRADRRCQDSRGGRHRRTPACRRPGRTTWPTTTTDEGSS